MKLLSNDKAQAGGIIMFVLAFFIIGFLYIIISGVEAQYVTQNNAIMANPNIPYSQSHYDAMDGLFAYWWAIPIIATVILIIYAIKNSISDTTEQAY